MSVQQPTTGTVVDCLKFSALQKVLEAVGLVVDSIEQMTGVTLSRDRLLSTDFVLKVIDMKSALRGVYPSSRMTSLHANSLDKCRCPGVCMVRQLLKEHGIKMKPQVRSAGYDARGRKRVTREYVLVPAAK